MNLRCATFNIAQSTMVPSEQLQIKLLHLSFDVGAEMYTKTEDSEIQKHEILPKSPVLYMNESSANMDSSRDDTSLSQESIVIASPSFARLNR